MDVFFIFKDIFKEIKILNNSNAIPESDIPVKAIKGKWWFFAQLMNNYFNGYEYNTGFSTKCPCGENFPKQIDKSTETDRLREIPSSDN